MARFALIQKATFNGKIYWFWESQFRGTFNYYGPFVNRNHFAGWMLLASALTAGFLIGQIQAAAARLNATWRSRILWLSTSEASGILLTAAALLAMLVSTMWSMSRSGMAGTALALILLAGTAARRVTSMTQKVLAAGAVLLALLAAASLAWCGYVGGLVRPDGDL